MPDSADRTAFLPGSQANTVTDGHPALGDRTAMQTTKEVLRVHMRRIVALVLTVVAIAVLAGLLMADRQAAAHPSYTYRPGCHCGEPMPGEIGRKFGRR